MQAWCEKFQSKGTVRHECRAFPNALCPPAQHTGIRVGSKTIHGKIWVDMGLEETVSFSNYSEAVNVGGMNKED